MKSNVITRLLLIIAVVLQCTPILAADGWNAGAAKVVVTPDEPIWMSGYVRTHRSEGKDQDLWAKALALEDAKGHRAVLITMDLIGVDRATGQAVCDQLKARHGLERRQIALNASHTHCGPAVGRNLDGLFNFDAEEQLRVDKYTGQLIEKLVAVAGEAIKNLQPASIACGQGFSTIAVNRRNNQGLDLTKSREQGLLQGPSDFDVPVLTVRDATGKLQAVAFGYACHATVLDVEYKFSGDFPGFAQAALEESHPGAIALFWTGCGGDQAPRPKGTMKQTEAYGRRLAAAVDEVLGGQMRALPPSLVMNYDEIDIRLATPPTRDQLRTSTESKNEFTAKLSKRLLSELDAGQALRQTYPYPVQHWGIGDQHWIFLGGEVVVDYALRLKRELGHTTWVAGYSNDVMAYIPSARIVREGGYEGINAQVYYSFPTAWSEDIEEQIVGQVRHIYKQADIGEEGFESVFNGRDLKGWAGAVDSYQVAEGAIVCQPEKGGILFTEREYGNFVARLEFKLSPGGNNGLAIRYPGIGRVAYAGMCELQILDDGDPKHAKIDPRQCHGSAYGMVAARRGHLKPAGEWNFQEVTVVGSTIKVELNGFVILDTDLSQVTTFMDDEPHPGKDLLRGHFGFAGHRDPVQFRNVRIKSLDAQPGGKRTP